MRSDDERRAGAQDIDAQGEDAMRRLERGQKRWRQADAVEFWSSAVSFGAGLVACGLLIVALLKFGAGAWEPGFRLAAYCLLSTLAAAGVSYAGRVLARGLRWRDD